MEVSLEGFPSSLCQIPRSFFLSPLHHGVMTRICRWFSKQTTWVKNKAPSPGGPWNVCLQILLVSLISPMLIHHFGISESVLLAFYLCVYLVYRSGPSALFRPNGTGSFPEYIRNPFPVHFLSSPPAPPFGLSSYIFKNNSHYYSHPTTFSGSWDKPLCRA